jgi:hypothetical protein
MFILHGIGSLLRDHGQAVQTQIGGEEKNTVGFLRRQEERVAARFLVWHYRRMNRAVPAPSILQSQAVKIVADAHRIARKTGGNVMSIIKELIEDLKKSGG